MTEGRKIIVIPKVERPTIDVSTGERKKKRVAAYARVSTDMEDQKNSLETQKAEYTKRIKENPEWEFVELYFDEGITGTNTKKRDGFNRMIKDALSGKIDLILVKSISRFARNTVDCIATKRALQDKGVEIFFEKENISSLDSSSETMLTIYASFAQEESRQISTNVTWGIRSKMRQGSYNGYSKRILGYKRDDEGNLIIDEEGKKAVLRIFEMFVDGYSYREIIDYLKKNGIKNAKGECKWDVGAIHRILTNEKYCGDLIYQKTYCNNYLTHERRKNLGEVEQYLITEHHERIVDKDLFMFVQMLLRKRRDDYDPRTGNKNATALAGLVYCATCGRLMRRILYYKGKPYERHVLTCKVDGRKNRNYSDCPQRETLDYQLVEDAAKVIVEERLGQLDMDLLLDSIRKGKTIGDFYTRSEEIKEEIEKAQNELNELVKRQMKECLPLSSYQKAYKALQEKINSLKNESENVLMKAYENNRKNNFNEDLEGFLHEKTTFSPKIASLLIKRIYRLEDNSVLFVLSNKPVDEKTLKSIGKSSSDYLYLPKKVIDKNDRKLTYRILDLEEKEHE